MPKLRFAAAALLFVVASTSAQEYPANLHNPSRED
jgi:hypothetical protein